MIGRLLSLGGFLIRGRGLRKLGPVLGPMQAATWLGPSASPMRLMTCQNLRGFPGNLCPTKESEKQGCFSRFRDGGFVSGKCLRFTKFPCKSCVDPFGRQHSRVLAGDFCKTAHQEHVKQRSHEEGKQCTVHAFNFFNKSTAKGELV